MQQARASLGTQVFVTDRAHNSNNGRDTRKPAYFNEWKQNVEEWAR